MTYNINIKEKDFKSYIFNYVLCIIDYVLY